MAMRDEHAPTLRVIHVLEAVAHEKNSLNLAEIAKKTKSPKTSLFPIVHTLLKNKYLQSNNGSYSLGVKTIELGVNFLNQNNAMEEIRKIIHSLAETCLETCHLGILDKGYVLYLYKEDSKEPIRMYSSIGKHLPAYGTAVGKALLSGCTAEELRLFYPNGLQSLTKNTITDFNELDRQLEDVRSTGYAYEQEESNPMIHCIGVPLKKDGKVVAAISVAIPTFRITPEKIVISKKALLVAKNTIENIMIYTDFDFGFLD